MNWDKRDPLLRLTRAPDGNGGSEGLPRTDVNPSVLSPLLSQRLRQTVFRKPCHALTCYGWNFVSVLSLKQCEKNRLASLDFCLRTGAGP